MNYTLLPTLYKQSDSERQKSIKGLNFSRDINFCLPSKRQQEETSKANMSKLFSSRRNNHDEKHVMGEALPGAHPWWLHRVPSP